MSTMSFISGRTDGGFVRVGHNSGATNPDAVWGFAIGDSSMSSINSVVISYNWNNTEAGSGWSGTYTYICVITDAADVGIMGATVAIGGASGTGTVTISGLNLIPGTTYHVHWNFNGSTLSTMKEFYQGVQGIDILTYTVANTAPYFSSGAAISVSTTPSSNYNGNYINGSTINLSWPAANDAEGNVVKYVLATYDTGSWVTQDLGNILSKTINHNCTPGELIQLAIIATDSGGLSSGWIYGPNPIVNHPVSMGGSFTNNGTARPTSTVIQWPAASHSGGFSSGYSAVSYTLYVGGVAKYTGTATSTTISLSGYTRGSSIALQVVATDGWTTSDLTGSIIYNDLPVVSGFTPAATTTVATVIEDTMPLNWNTTNTYGTLSHNVYYRQATTAAGLSSVGWTTLVTGLAATAYSHSTSMITKGRFFQYMVRPSDGIETGADVTSPIYQKNADPSPATGLSFTSPSGTNVITEDSITFTWDSALTHTLSSSGIVVSNVSYILQYAIKRVGGSYGGWTTLVTRAVSDGIDEEKIITDIKTTFGLNRGDSVKFQVQVVDELGYGSTWISTGDCKYNSLPNVIPTSNIIVPTTTVYPEKSNYLTPTAFSITGTGDPDAQDTFFYVELGMGKSGGAQTWKTISSAWLNQVDGWVPAGATPWTYDSGTFDFSSVAYGGLVNSAPYFGTEFNVNDIYNNCQIRVKVKDSLGVELGSYAMSNVFTVDYREAPDPVTITTPLTYTKANGKDNRINPGQVVSLAWTAPTDRNLVNVESFSYKIYLSINGGTYSNIANVGTGVLTYDYVTSEYSIDTIINFKIVAVDSTSLISAIVSTTASPNLTVCRLTNPTISLINDLTYPTARNTLDPTKLDAYVIVSNIGGSREALDDTQSEIYNYWDSKNNLTGVSYEIQYSLSNTFPEPLAGTIAGTYNGSGTVSGPFSATNVPPFIYSTIDASTVTPMLLTSSTAALDTSKGYYVRAFITITSGLITKTAASNIIYVRESYPTIAHRKNRMSINKGTPEDIPTKPALTIYGSPDDYATIVEIGANGRNDTYIGFRSDSADLALLTGKMGIIKDGINYVFKMFVGNMSGTYKTLSAKDDGVLSWDGSISGTQLISTIAIGTAPLTVVSTTNVTNLNADYLDGLHSTAFATAAQGTLANNALPASSYTAADILAKLITVDGSGTTLDADLLDGYHADSASTINTIALRNSSGDIQSRLFRSEYADATTISGAIAYRIDNGTNNYIRFCTSGAAVLAWMGVTATAAELNKLDGVTATTTELNYVDGVTSAIQTQLNNIVTSGTGTRSAWTKFADGTMVERGFGYFTGDGTVRMAHTLTFPTAFYAIPQSIVLSPLGYRVITSGAPTTLGSITSAFGETHTVMATGTSTTASSIYWQIGTGVANTAVYYIYSWEAWGRWKA